MFGRLFLGSSSLLILTGWPFPQHMPGGQEVWTLVLGPLERAMWSWPLLLQVWNEWVAVGIPEGPVQFTSPGSPSFTGLF